MKEKEGLKKENRLLKLEINQNLEASERDKEKQPLIRKIGNLVCGSSREMLTTYQSADDEEIEIKTGARNSKHSHCNMKNKILILCDEYG